MKAGILKCATDHPGVTPAVEEVLRAVARAHRATGVPISTHTEPATRRGLEQQKVFESEGVDLSRVVIGHSGDTADLEYLEELLARGSYLGMDRFGLYGILSFEERVRTVVELCERGHVERLVLSHDAACYNDWLPQGGGAFGPWTTATSPRTCSPRCATAGLGDDRDQHHARRQPPPALRRRGRRTEMAERTPPIGAQITAGRPVPRRARSHLRGPHPHRAEFDASRTGWRVRSPSSGRPGRLHHDRAAQLHRVPSAAIAAWKLGAVPQPLPADARPRIRWA